MAGRGSGDQPSGNLAADRVFLGLRTTDPVGLTGVVQLYVKDAGSGEMTLFATQPLELGGASQEIAGLSQAEIELLIAQETSGITSTWRQSVITTANDPVLFGTDGQRYLVDTAPTGSWSSNADDVAVRDGTGDVWRFQITQEGYRLFDIAAGVWKLFVGGAWAVEGGIVAIWERSGTTLSPVNAGDDLDLEDGDLQNVARISGGGGAQTIIEGDTISGDSVSIRGSSDSARPSLDVVDQAGVAVILEDGTGQEFIVQDDDATPAISLRIVRTDGAVRVPIGLTVGLNSVPTTGALVDFISTTGGLLIPRMDTTDRDLLTTTTSLLIWNTTTTQFEFFDGSAWVALVGGGTPTLDRFFGYTTATVAAAVANTFQDVDFLVQPVASGITWDDANDEIELPAAGDYRVELSASVDKTAGASSIAEFRALLDGVEVAGSAMGILVAANNAVASVGATFTVIATGAQPLKIQFAGGTTNTRFVPGAANATTKPSVQVTVTRLS